MQTRKKKGWLHWLLTAGTAALAVWALLAAVANLESGRTGEDRRQLEETLRRATVTCYATEGIYPPSLAYLEEHYGVQINTKYYTVYYDAFAENLMPDITVLENGE